MNERTLLVSAAFFPENSPRSFRATELATALARMGHSVDLLTFAHPETVAYCSKYGIKLLALKEPRSRWPLIRPTTWVSRAINRLLLQLFEYPEIALLMTFRKYLGSLTGYDRVISFAVPHPVHWAVASVRNKRKPIGKLWIADCGDPYYGNTSDSFRKLFYFKYIEDFALRRADYIVVPVEAARSAYAIEFHDKIVVIPQGVDLVALRKSRSIYQPQAIPAFAYAGSFIPGKRDPRPFLKFLRSLEVPFRFHLYTQQIELVREICPPDDDRFVVHPYLNRPELINRLSGMDFLVNVENDSVVQTPSKLIDYFAAGRPVLSVPNLGVPKVFIHQFLQGNYDGQANLEEYEKYAIQNVIQSFLALK